MSAPAAGTGDGDTRPARCDRARQPPPPLDQHHGCTGVSRLYWKMLHDLWKFNLILISACGLAFGQ